MKYVKLLVLLAIVSMFSGCSALMPDNAIKDLSPDQLTALATTTSQASEECHKVMVQQLASEIQMLQHMDKTQLYYYMTQQQFADLAKETNLTNQMLVSHITGQEIPTAQNECGMNVWDYFAATDAAKYAFAGKITDTIQTLGSVGLKFWGYNKIAETVVGGMGTHVTNVGDANSVAGVGNNYNVGDDAVDLTDNSLSGNKEDSVVSKSPQGNAGDGSLTNTEDHSTELIPNVQ